MFKFFTSSHHNKLYKDLSKLGLFSESIAIEYIKYQEYFRDFFNIKLNFAQYFKIFINQQPTSLKIIKALLFLHAWLQSQAVLDDSEAILELMNHFLKNCGELVESSKASKLLQMKRKKSRSVVMNLDMDRQSKQVQFNKQIFLLEDIIKPYILYLQKIITVFSFYSSIKKNMFRVINMSQVWIIMNLFKCANAIIAKIPIICRFIRKSYKPIAECLAQAFSLDFSFFYLKVYKFIYNQCNKIQHHFDLLVDKLGELEAYIQGVSGADTIANLVDQIKQLNVEMHALYGEPTFKGNRKIVEPMLIDINDEQIQFILYLEKMKNNAQLYQKTPKFFRSHQSKNTTQNQNEQINQLQLGVFKNISNENYQKLNEMHNICTFRRDDDSLEIENRVTCHSMVVKNKKDIEG